MLTLARILNGAGSYLLQIFKTLYRHMTRVKKGHCCHIKIKNTMKTPTTITRKKRKEKNQNKRENLDKLTTLPLYVEE